MINSENSVLIITRNFPPYHNVVGAMVRTVKLAAFLQNQGWNVHVLANAGRRYGYFGYENTVEKLNTHYLGNAATAPPRESPDAAPQASTRGRSVELFAKSVLRDILVPDASVVSVPKYYRTALEIIRRHGIKNVIISSPPHSTQLAGVLLKRKLGSALNLVVDYRDSWNCGKKIYSKRNPLSSSLNLLFEKTVLKYADHFLYVSDPMLSKINRRFFDITEKATLVMNGFDDENRIPLDHFYERGDTLTVAHFGAINAYQRVYRDPIPLFDAIIKTGLPIKIALYGHVECAEEWKTKMGANLELRGNLPHDGAIAEMMKSDVLLFLHTMKEASDEIVSGKLFDYMLARRPILVIGPSDMEAVKIVQENRLGYCLDVFDPGGMQAGLKKLYCAWQERSLPDLTSKDISAFGRKRQYEKVLNLLRQKPLRHK